MVNYPGRSSGSWFVLLPVPSHPQTGQWRWRVSSPFTAAGPRGIRTLFPYPEIINVWWHSRRQGQFLSSSLMCGHPRPAAMAAQRPLTTAGNITTFQFLQRHGVCVIVCKGWQLGGVSARVICGRTPVDSTYYP